MNLDLSEFQGLFREECGIIVGTIKNGERLIYQVIKVPNLAIGDDDYAISMQDFRRVQKQCVLMNKKVLGFLHTHLMHHSSEPTDTDFDGAKLFPEYINCVYQPSTRKLVWYSGETD